MSKAHVDIYMTTHGINYELFERLKADYPRLVIKDIRELRKQLTNDAIERIKGI